MSVERGAWYEPYHKLLRKIILFSVCKGGLWNVSQINARKNSRQAPLLVHFSLPVVLCFKCMNWVFCQLGCMPSHLTSCLKGPELAKTSRHLRQQPNSGHPFCGTLLGQWLWPLLNNMSITFAAAALNWKRGRWSEKGNVPIINLLPGLTTSQMASPSKT